MTSFCHQLSLLLWKNYLLRKRHKIRVLIELLCPLILFLIFMWVRTKGLKFNKPYCHLVEKALPSVGGFEFIQNYICTLNNTCHPDVVEDKGPKEWEDALIVRFIRESGPLIRELLERQEGVDTVHSLWNFTTNYVKHQAGNQSRQNIAGKGNTTLGELLTQKAREDFLTAAPIYIQISQAEELLKSVIVLPDLNYKAVDVFMEDMANGSCPDPNKYKFIVFPTKDVYDAVCGLGIWRTEFLKTLFRDYLQKNEIGQMVQEALESEQAEDLVPLSLSGVDSQSIITLIKLARLFNEFYNQSKEFAPMPTEESASTPGSGTVVGSATRFIFKGLCGLSVNPNASSFGFDDSEATNRMDSLRDRLRDWRSHKAYEADPEVDELCNNIFQQLHSRPYTRLIWKQIKPFIRGQILYAPKSNFTTELMDRVDNRFMELKNLEDNVNALLSIIHRIRVWFDANEKRLEQMQTFLKQPSSQAQIMIMLQLYGATAFQGNIAKDVQKLLTKLTEYDLKEVEMLLETMDFGFESDSHILSCIRYKKSVPLKNEAEAVRQGMELMSDNKLWAVVVFEDLLSDGSAPHHLKYKIRMDSDKVDGTRLIRDRQTSTTPRRRPTLDLKYITNGFIYLQEMVEHSFIEMTTGKNISDEVSTFIQQFPFPCYIFDQFVKAISRTFPLFMVLSWVYASAMIVKSIVLEKERRLKEVMKVMGLSNSVIWIGWFIDSFAVMSLSAIGLTAILKYGKIVEYSDFSLLLVFMLCFTIATICFSFLVSTFFSKANSAAAAGGILFFVSYLPYNFMLLWEERLTWHHLLSSCLISNVAFGFGCTYLARYEEDGIGAQWNRISLQTMPDDDFNLAYCILMLLFDSVLYLFLTFYIENVFPGDSGMPKKWYFLVQKSYWVPSSYNRKTNNYDAGVTTTLLQEGPLDSIESEPRDLRLGVEVSNLSKVYPNGRIALSNLNMNFYESQITSFLGHNGAGKTTSISILTGLFPPTKGTAKIYGLDIRKQMSEIRKDLGICPQYNVLFDRLTVEEHLRFYASLKGKEKECEDEMDNMLLDLGIPHKRKDYPSSLSGGMKRKLSVACAFVGGSKTVFLDEPTSGVDPYSRRSIWELLLKYKNGRTIILTTHFMDEADLLGDRIAIISQGRLVASGSSLFLKSHYGRGYSLRLVRQEMSPREEELFLLNNIEPDVPRNHETMSMAKSIALARHADLCTNFIHFRIPEAILVDDVGSEVLYLLPYSSLQSFPSLFHDLDENLDNLRISSYGISDTTLEDVFLKITADDLEVNNWNNSGTFCNTCCFNPKIMSDLWKRKKRFKQTKVGSTEIEPPPVIVHNIDAGYITPADHIIPSVQQQLLEHNESKTPRPVSTSSSVTNTTGATNMTSLSISPDIAEAEPEPETNEALLENHDERNALRFDFKTPPHRLPVHLFFLQISVILLKRLRNSIRNLRAMFFEIILPVVFIAFALALTLILPPNQNEDPREVTPWAYPSPNYIFFAEPQKESTPGFAKFVDEIVGPVGLGTPCMTDKKSTHCYPEKWSNATVQDFLMKRANYNGSKLGDCDCNVGSFQCSQEVENPPPPKLKTPSNDFIIDVTKMESVPKWVKQTYHYKQYEHRRLGGYEMMRRPPAAISFSEYVFLLESLTSLTKIVDQSKTLLDAEPSVMPFYKVWFENRAWLSSTAYLNAMNNALLREYLDPSVNEAPKSKYGITLTTHPMELTKLQQEKESLKTAALGVVHAICVIFALGFVPASFTMYLIEERSSGAKHLHLVSGVKPITYWISNLTFDMMKYLISAGLIFILFLIFDAEAYISSPSIAGFAVLLILYGWASIPLMYPASYIFSVPSTAFVVLACTNLFIGVISTVSVFVLEQLGDEDLKEIGDILQEVYLIFPQYCLGRGLMTLVKLHIEDTAFARLTSEEGTRNRFEWDQLGQILCILVAHGAVFFLLNLCFEYKQWLYLLCKKKYNKKWSPSEISGAVIEDIDVRKEADRVLKKPPPTATLTAENLTKIYAGKKQPAVNKVSFAVEHGECFGLLGVNGAGKTSTFKMLTGDVRISYGKAKIMGHDVEKSLDSARKHFGYCPQEDGLDPLLNTYEQLQLFGRLRGMTSADVKNVSIQLVGALGLTRYADKKCGTYSGGNRRKVSTAIALIGNPDLVFLDEPTSGMDPGARRQLWKVILKIVHGGKSVVLTSHSMEECEALCNRLAIMVNGKFTCLGSLQHLKNRFGNGYMLTVRCGQNKRERFLTNLHSDLPSAILHDTHCSQLKFKVLQQDVKLGDIFSVMHREKDLGLVEDYSVSQTTLDDIFVKFASQQRDELDGKIGHNHNNLTVTCLKL